MQFSLRKPSVLAAHNLSCFWFRLNLAQALWAIKEVQPCSFLFFNNDEWFEWWFGGSSGTRWDVCAFMCVHMHSHAFVCVCVLAPSAISQGLRWSMLPRCDFRFTPCGVMEPSFISLLLFSDCREKINLFALVHLELNCVKASNLIKILVKAGFFQIYSALTRLSTP